MFSLHAPSFGEDHHFCRIFKGDMMKDAFSRHRIYLFSQLALRPGMRVLHVGCGTGTASLELAFFSNVMVVGIDTDAEKIQTARREAANAHLANLVAFEHVTDISKVDHIFPPSSFDAAFAIEVLNYLPSFADLYRPLSDVLCLGGRFASYEWCWTTLLDQQDPEHRHLARLIEDALPIVRRQLSDRTIEAAALALTENGFQVVLAEDLACRNTPALIPWFSNLESALSERHYFWKWVDTENREGLNKRAAALLLKAGRLQLIAFYAHGSCGRNSYIGVLQYRSWKLDQCFYCDPQASLFLAEGEEVNVTGGE